MDSGFKGLFEALAFLTCMISFFVLMVCIKNDSTLHRMKRSLNRIERQMGFRETHEITFREFREIVKNFDDKEDEDKGGKSDVDSD